MIGLYVNKTEEEISGYLVNIPSTTIWTLCVNLEEIHPFFKDRFLKRINDYSPEVMRHFKNTEVAVVELPTEWGKALAKDDSDLHFKAVTLKDLWMEVFNSIGKMKKLRDVTKIEEETLQYTINMLLLYNDKTYNKRLMARELSR